MGVVDQDIFKTGSQECRKMRNSYTARASTKVRPRIVNICEDLPEKSVMLCEHFL